MSAPIQVPSSVRQDVSWHSVCDAMDEPVLIVDGKERVLDVNRAALRELHCTAERVRQLSLADLPDEPWRSCRALARMVRIRGSERERELRERRTGRHWSIHCRFIDVEGSEELAAERGDSGDPKESLLLLVLRETTEFHLLRNAMRHYEKSTWLADVVGGLAHQVNNPLFAISSSVDWLKLRLADSDDEAKVLAALQREIGRLSGLMRSFVEFSTTACRQRARQKLDVLIQEACSACRLGDAVGGVSLELEVEPGVEALVDRDAIVLALAKVLENSRDLSPAGGKIGITGRRLWLEPRGEAGSSPGFEIRVRDQGPGVSPAHRRQVFDPFFSRRSGHFGLGLALAERVLLAHGGSMEFEECHPGASLVMRLPVAVQPSDPEDSD